MRTLFYEPEEGQMVWMRRETGGKGTMQNTILRGKVKGKKNHEEGQQGIGIGERCMRLEIAKRDED